jgi:hypothetical protein
VLGAGAIHHIKSGNSIPKGRSNISAVEVVRALAASGVDLDGDRVDAVAVIIERQYILRCLGAAVIMRWNTIPAKLLRELFDTAGSLGDVL